MGAAPVAPGGGSGAMEFIAPLPGEFAFGGGSAAPLPSAGAAEIVEFDWEFAEPDGREAPPLETPGCFCLWNQYS